MNGLPPRVPVPMAPGIAGFSGGNPLRAIQGMKTAGAHQFNPSAPYASTLTANAPSMAERMAVLGGNGFQRAPQTFTPDWQAQHPSNTGFNFDQILAGIPASQPRPTTPAPTTPTGTPGGGAPPPNFAGAIQSAGATRPTTTSPPLSNAVTSANGTMISTAPRVALAPSSGIGTAEYTAPSSSSTSGGFASALSGGRTGYSNAADPERALKYMRGY